MPERDMIEQDGATQGNRIKSNPSSNSLANGSSHSDTCEVSANGKSSPSSPSSGYNKWQSKDSDRYRTDGSKHFARHSNNDKRRTQGGNAARSGRDGQNAASRDRDNQNGDNRDISGMRDIKKSHQNDVDEDQYER